MKTMPGQIRLIDGSMICGVSVYDDGDNYLDGAWGAWPEIAKWLEDKGYPQPDCTCDPKNRSEG